MAELKERHGLRRARCRRGTTVQIEALGAAIAYNVKELARGHRQCLHTPAAACRRPCANHFYGGETISAPLASRAWHWRLARQFLGHGQRSANHRQIPVFGNRPQGTI